MMNKALVLIVISTVLLAVFTSQSAVTAANTEASPVLLEEFVYLNATPNAHASTIVELYGNNTFVAAWFGGKGEGSDDTKIYIATKTGYVFFFIISHLLLLLRKRDVILIPPTFFQLQ